VKNDEIPLLKNANDDPLNGKFDLSGLQNQDLPIHFNFVTSFDALMQLKNQSERTQKTMNIVLIPKFMLDQSIPQLSSSLSSRMMIELESSPTRQRSLWAKDSDVAIFFYYQDGWIREENLFDNFRYSMSESMKSLKSKDLFSIWKSSNIVDKKQELAETMQNEDYRKEKAHTMTAMIFLGPCILTGIVLQSSHDCCVNFPCCECKEYVKELYEANCCGCLLCASCERNTNGFVVHNAWKYACPVFVLDNDDIKDCCNCSKTFSKVFNKAIICAKTDDDDDGRRYAKTCPTCLLWEGKILTNIPQCAWNIVAVLILIPFFPLTNLAWIYRKFIQDCAVPCLADCYKPSSDRIHPEMMNEESNNQNYKILAEELSRFHFSM
jgi:hypothetical protein